MSRRVALAVELDLDQAARRAVTAVFDALQAAGIEPLSSASSTMHPHVSLAVCEDTSASVVSAALHGVAAAGLPVLTLGCIGAFTDPADVVFLGITPSDALLALHAAVTARLGARSIKTWPLYAPGVWVPHCTVAMHPKDLAVALDAIRSAPLPIRVMPSSMRVVEVPTGRALARIS